MALNYSANQFEDAFRSKSLGNWEIPRWHPKYPLNKTSTTGFIANDRGHLLPGIRKLKTSPWGEFVSTWSLPKYITRDVAKQVSTVQKERIKEWNKRCQKEIDRNKKVAHISNKNIKDYTDDLTKKCKEEKFPPIADAEVVVAEKETTEIQKDANDNQVQEYDKLPVPYVPGDITRPDQRHSSYEMLAANRPTASRRAKSSRTIEHICKPEPARIPSPLANTYRNFATAKKFHKENLEHHPLPDMLTDAMYRKLQLKRVQNPGLALDEEPYASAIGTKGHKGTGPTQCTKLKVYRPKTSGDKSDGLEEESGFDNRWRFITQKEVNPIDLAICWDMTPENPADEPKRTPHIDGSNGSAAPAVFSMVHTPKEEPSKSRRSSVTKLDNEDKCNGVNGCGTPHSAKTNRHLPNIPQRSKTASTISTLRKIEAVREDYNKSRQLNKDKEFHRSSPNLSQASDEVKYNNRVLNPRLCVACELRSMPSLESKQKSEYKMAFKAGVPNNGSHNGGSEGSGSSAAAAVKNMWVPKQRDPFGKKSYCIDTLAPPFSLRKERRSQEYPEHWRLGSVYQHSYKPMELRKHPLIYSVFK